MPEILHRNPRRKKLETVPLLTRPVEPIPEPARPIIETIATRPIEPLVPVPEPSPVPGSLFDPNAPMVVYNNKARPIGVEGGGDVLTRNSALLNAQQDYKAPVSKKDMAIQALFGFLRGGIPGAVVNTAQYGLDPQYRNQVAMGPDIASTQNQIQRELITRKQTNELLNDQSQRGVEAARALQMARLPGFNLSPGQVRYENGQPVASLPDRPLITRDPPGFTLGPGQVRYGPDGKPIATGPGRPEKPDADSSQIESVIQEAQTERDRIGASLKDVPATITTPGITYSDGTTGPSETKPNPAYVDLMNRYRNLDDQIRDWKVKIKPKTAITRGSSVSEDQIREAARAKGLDPEKAIQKARQRRML